jgi:uncharacterized protein (DUF58 family)
MEPLEPAVLAAIGDLEFVARAIVDGSVSGLHRSPFHGYSAEFSQFRQYRPGDDLKYVDWKLFARTDRLYTKQYRETTNLSAQIVLDVSASMAFQGHGPVSKLDYGRLIAAALSYALLSQGDAAGLTAYAERIHTYVPPRAGTSQTRRLLVSLARVVPAGATATAAAIRRAIDLLDRRGLVIVISDLYDESDALDRELRRAARIGHDVALFHILARDEVDLGTSGPIEFEDMETGATLVAEIARERYAAAVEAFIGRWRARCTSLGIDFTQLFTDTPPSSALRAHFLKRLGEAQR